jgi:FkbM family methyltransferase
MWRYIKQKLTKFCPNLAAAFLMYRALRGMNREWSRVPHQGFIFTGNETMSKGAFETEETALILRYLREAQIFVDIGANIGFFTCLARSLSSYTIAVEPLNQNLDFLYANLNANGWHDVEVFPVGLSAKPGIATLYGASTGASLVKRWAGNSETLARSIAVSTLDIILGERFVGQRVFIKIDVEGAEYGVLQGAEKTLKRVPSPVWLLEICLTEHFAEEINHHFAETFQTFWQHGYEARTVGENSRIVNPEDIERWVRNKVRDFGHVSYLFEKASS